MSWVWDVVAGLAALAAVGALVTRLTNPPEAPFVFTLPGGCHNLPLGSIIATSTGRTNTS